MRRDFSVQVDSCGEREVLLSVTYDDYDRAGRRISGSKRRPIVVKRLLADYSLPMDLIQDACHQATPEVFSVAVRLPAGERQPAVVNGVIGTKWEAELARLVSGEGLRKGSVGVAGESVERFRQTMWRLGRPPVTPTFDVTQNGQVRVRWNNGSHRALTVTFPAIGPLGATIAWKRHGDYGMAQVRCLIEEERDLVEFAALSGVPIVPSPG